MCSFGTERLQDQVGQKPLSTGVVLKISHNIVGYSHNNCTTITQVYLEGRLILLVTGTQQGKRDIHFLSSLVAFIVYLSTMMLVSMDKSSSCVPVQFLCIK